MSLVEGSYRGRQEDQPNQRRLVAYVVPRSGELPTISALRSMLTDKLPEYMIPSTYVVLDRLPRLPSGKVDRQLCRAES